MKILTILIILALVATIAALGTGFVSMLRGGKFDEAHADQFMMARVGFQGLAVALLITALLVAGD